MSADAKKPLVSANQASKELGLGVATFLKLYRDGVFDAEIHEGALIRFDLDKVRARLAERAMENRGEVHGRMEVAV